MRPDVASRKLPGMPAYAVDLVPGDVVETSWGLYTILSSEEGVEASDDLRILTCWINGKIFTYQVPRGYPDDTEFVSTGVYADLG